MENERYLFHRQRMECQTETVNQRIVKRFTSIKVNKNIKFFIQVFISPSRTKSVVC